MSRHSCDALGCCQQRTPACLGCEHHAMAPFVQAGRDTGCFLLGPDDDNTTQTLTRAERVGYWLGVGCVVGMSVVTAFGLAGYLVAKLI